MSDAYHDGHIPRTRDYLKYRRIAYYYVQEKYDVTFGDLEMLLFLYTEPWFSSTKFREYAQLIGWHKDRLNSLISRGYVQTFPGQEKNHKKMMRISPKGSRIVTQLYNILEGKEVNIKTIETPQYVRTKSYKDKIYINFMKLIQKRRRATLNRIGGPRKNRDED